MMHMVGAVSSRLNRHSKNICSEPSPELYVPRGKLTMKKVHACLLVQLPRF